MTQENRFAEPRRTMTTDEVAAALGLTRSAVYAALNRGQIPATKVGKQWLIARSAIDALAAPVTIQ